MATVAALTQLITSSDLVQISTTSGDFTRTRVIVRASDTGLYIGPFSMGTGNAGAFLNSPPDVNAFELLPNQDYTLFVCSGQGATDGVLFATSTSSDGVVMTSLSLETVS